MFETAPSAIRPYEMEVLNTGVRAAHPCAIERPQRFEVRGLGREEPDPVFVKAMASGGGSWAARARRKLPKSFAPSASSPRPVEFAPINSSADIRRTLRRKD
jgi:hypothetical protein